MYDVSHRGSLNPKGHILKKIHGLIIPDSFLNSL